MGQPDQSGAAAPSAATKGKAAIIKALPHAQAIALGVKTHQRNEHQVEGAGRDGFRPAWRRLQHAPGVWKQRFALAVAQKHQAVRAARMQAGQIAVFAPGQGIGKQQAGVDLPITCQVERNASGTQIIALMADAMVQAVGGKQLLPGRQGATGRSQGFS